MHINRFPYLLKQRPNMFLFFPWTLLNKMEYCSDQQSWIVIIFLVKTLSIASTTSTVTLLWRPQSLDISYSVKNLKPLFFCKGVYHAISEIFTDRYQNWWLFGYLFSISTSLCFLAISDLVVCEYFCNANITLQMNIT